MDFETEKYRKISVTRLSNWRSVTDPTTSVPSGRSVLIRRRIEGFSAGCWCSSVKLLLISCSRSPASGSTFSRTNKTDRFSRRDRSHFRLTEHPLHRTSVTEDFSKSRLQRVLKVSENWKSEPSGKSRPWIQTLNPKKWIRDDVQKALECCKVYSANLEENSDFSPENRRVQIQRI